MGISERKEREKHEKRRMILDTAIQLFIDEGYENVSIRKIADKIEYSPATIYLYFQDKDEILSNLQQEGFVKFYNFLHQAESVTDPRERVKELGRMYVRFGLEHPEYYDLMFYSQSSDEKIRRNKGVDRGSREFYGASPYSGICDGKGSGKAGSSHASGFWALVLCSRNSSSG